MYVYKMVTKVGMYSATRESVTVARGQRQENTDRVKNQSDCRIRYRALWKKKSLYNTAMYVIMIYITSPVVFIVIKVSRLTSRVKNDFIENRQGLSSLESFALDFKEKFIFFLSPFTRPLPPPSGITLYQT